MRTARIPHRQSKEETVALAGGERGGACRVKRVLSGEHHEGSRQGHRRAVCCDLTFLHRLEKGGL